MDEQSPAEERHVSQAGETVVNDVLYRVKHSGPRKTPTLVHKDLLRQYRGATVDTRWAGIARDNRRCPGSGQDNIATTGRQSSSEPAREQSPSTSSGLGINLYDIVIEFPHVHMVV